MTALHVTPNEIWLAIFELATEVPDPLVCFVHDYHGTRRNISGGPFRRYKEALATKVVLCAVSRHWNAVATPLLYDRIIISSYPGMNEDIARDFNLLHRSLSSSPSPQPPNCPTPPSAGNLTGQTRRRLGSLVRRLDLSLWDNEDEQSAQYVDFVNSAIPRLAQELPNLEILSVRVPSSVSPLDGLRALPTRLKHLHWERMGFEPHLPYPLPVLTLLDFLDTHPVLETFHMIVNLEELGLEPETSASLWKGRSYPSLRHWVLRDNHIDFMASAPPNVFPNLEALTLPVYAEADADLPRIAKYLQVHGGRLTQMRLSPDQSLGVLLQTVGSWCPQLEEICLAYTWRWRWPTPEVITSASVMTQIPKIAVLGLIFCNHGLSSRRNHGWQRVLLLQWKALFPGLRTVKLMEELDVSRLREGSGDLGVEKAIRFYTQQGVVLEDNFGRPLSETGPTP